MGEQGALEARDLWAHQDLPAVSPKANFTTPVPGRLQLRARRDFSAAAFKSGSLSVSAELVHARSSGASSGGRTHDAAGS